MPVGAGTSKEARPLLGRLLVFDVLAAIGRPDGRNLV